MMNTEAMCTLLAVALVAILMSSGMRNRMALGAPKEDCGCDSAVCGRKATNSGVASARTASTAAASPPEVDAAPHYESSGDSHSLEETKRNLVAANRSAFGRDQTTCRTDFVGRTQGIRTGALWAVLDAENRNKAAAPTTASWLPTFGAPEHAAPLSESEVRRE